MALESFAVSVSRHGDELVITCAGELDMLGAEELHPIIEREVSITPISGCVWIDCSAISFVDSIGIKSLLFARQLCLERAIDFTLEPSAPMRKLLETIGAAPALSMTP